MRKFLLTATLILAMVVSLTAGTMAYYTTTIRTAADPQAVKFQYTDQNGGDSYSIKVDIAPGDTLKYRFTVTNSSEIRVLSVFTTLFAENGETLENDAIRGLHVQVVRTSDVSDSDGAYADGSRAITAIMDVDQVDTYEVTVAWSYARGESAGSNRSLRLVVAANGQNSMSGTAVLSGDGARAERASNPGVTDRGSNE